jgi:hypothetical protein
MIISRLDAGWSFNCWTTSREVVRFGLEDHDRRDFGLVPWKGQSE